MIVVKCNYLEINDLLPLLANNTMDELKKTGVFMHLDKCSVCRADYALLLNIKESASMKDQEEHQLAFNEIFKNIVNEIRPDMDHAPIRERFVQDILHNPISIDILSCLRDETREEIRYKVDELKQNLSPISSYFHLLNQMLNLIKY